MLNYLRTVPLVLSALLLVRAHSVHADELLSLFQDSVVFTNVGYASGSTVISNFPLRVDISAVRPNGFDYSLAGSKADELRFNFKDEYLDHGTNAVIDMTVDFAVTNWNSDADSTLYVNLPRFNNSANAKLTMYWNPVDYAEIPENDPDSVPIPVTNATASAEWNRAIEDQATNENYIACGPAMRNGKLINYWLVEPTISKKTWKQGEEGADITPGTPFHASAESTVEYYDRNTSESLGEVQPLTPGAYKAVVTVAADETYAELTKALVFDITSAVVIGGQAGTNDFACSATFALTGSLVDNSLAASFNYKKTSDGLTKAVSTTDYQTEITTSGEVSLGCWFRLDPSVIGGQPYDSGKDNRDNVQLVSFCDAAAPRGPLSLTISNNKSTSAASELRLKAGGAYGRTAEDDWALVSVKCEAIGDGAWHFAVATRCKATGVVCLYLDGELIGTRTHADCEFYDTGAANNFAIGGSPTATSNRSQGFIGYIAEAQAYNVVLSADTVKALYDSKLRLTGTEEGLLAYYPLNDGTVAGEYTGEVLADKNKSGMGTYDITAAGYLKWEEPVVALPFKAGMDVLDGKPFLVRLSDGSPKGFYYENLTFGKTAEAFYSDVRFYDESGEPLDYKIDTWNVDGESQIWVKVKKYSSSTKVIMCWGQGAYTELPENDPSAVWDPEATEEDIEDTRSYYVNHYDSMVTIGKARENASKRLQNRWVTQPSMSMVQWAPGETPPTVVPGTTKGGPAKVYYWDRSTGQALSSLPVAEIGEYRAIFQFAETEYWSSLERTIDFRIVKESDSHKLGEVAARVLLANNDESVSGGQVYAQSYDDNEEGWGMPYWTHHDGDGVDVSDFDATKLFTAFNLFPGTCHEFMSGTNRLWGLSHVRFGNLFNNARHYPRECGDTGLRADQNYLPWNPESSRMLGYEGLKVGDYHRYAGTFVLQNVADSRMKDYAQICSPCYDEGIGTIYFDVVNAFTNNVRDADGNANYAIVVEVATNIVGFVERPPVDAIYPDGMCSAYDYYFYADWHAVEMVPIRFRDDTGTDTVDCERLSATEELELDITSGGTRKNFYRVYVPLNLDCKARFRIRRTRIDESASLNPDANAFIIVDNLICSPSRDMLRLEPYGWYDPAKGGKQLLGQEMAFDPPFPGVGDAVYGRVRAFDRTGAEAAPGDVTAVSMHYRWTYLNQAKTDWAVSDFYPSTLRSISPLVLPAGLPGDIEFWFEGSQNSGYYSYANYSGTKIGVPWYSESYSLITNGWDGTSAEWSVRLREGRSDYEQAVLVVREPWGSTREIQMALMEDHQWRGYYQTTNAIADGVDVRIEFRNYQDRDEGLIKWSWNTNSCYLATSKDLDIPYSGPMAEGTTNNWTHVPVDAYTGYLMFQADDDTKGLSIVRADYQNFNRWTDCHGTNVLFVGTAADESGLPASGSSPLTREFGVDYTTNQTVAVATNGLWCLDFNSDRTYTYYKTFAAGDETVNAWPLGKGRFVYGLYRDPASGTALQMAGCGEGYAEFSDQTLGLWPRGVEKVTFGARLAQSIGFDDFSYWDGDSQKKNYCFYAKGAFDLDDNNSFTGNASLSLVGYYRRGKGCYEFRWEQTKGKVDSTTSIVHGHAPQGQTLTIYRWNRNSAGGYDATELCTVENSSTFQFNMPTFGAGATLAEGKFMPMLMAVYEYPKTNPTGTMIVVGVNSSGETASGSDSSGWRYAAYFDCSDSRLKSGSYGILTANSGGCFVTPKIGSASGTTTWPSLTLPEANKGANSGKDPRTLATGLALTSCEDSIKDEMWVTIPGRNDAFVEDGVYGFKAADVGQTIDVIASRTVNGVKYDTVLASHSISNHWGTVKVKEEFGGEEPLIWRTEDAFLRLRTGGDLDGIRTDVVIDDIKVYQWRGRNEIVLYKADGTENSPDNANDSRTATNGDPANFVYTSGWVTKYDSTHTSLEVSARRTIPGRPAGVRTPLMDGYSGRGSGIGNLEFHYRNCQTNTALLVQIATNVYRGNLEALTKEVTEGDGNSSWTTICRLDYGILGEAGSTNIAFGIRKGGNDNGCVARVILDPELVESVATNDDTTAFGSIEFTRVVCQDEPPINKGCWWGWNVRTLGNEGDTEKRMYLPDASERMGVGYSMALNNSTTADIDETKKKYYSRHMPFLQSPSFTNENVIGEVSFRARKYSNSGYSQYAEVAVYGVTLDKMAKADDNDWQLLTRFIVSNTVFTTYTYRAIDDGKFSAIRLGVTGVSGVKSTSRGPAPQCGDEPVRVLLDEVTICEAVNPELAIRNLGAFRYDMQSSEAALNVPSRSQQPLCREGWGVQCELYAVMLEDQISTRHPPKVKLYWYEGTDVWGWENWKDRAQSGWLARATGTKSLIYRSSYDTAPGAVIPQSVKEDLFSPVVQYMVEIFYTTVDPKTGAETQKSKFVDVKTEWEVPEWYAPIDYNNDKNYGKGEDYSCFCILDDVAPGWAWINEINLLGEVDEDQCNTDRNCQFVEIAAPVTADLSGWKLQFIEPYASAGGLVTNTVATFGMPNLPSGTKSLNEISNYVFHVVANPDIKDSYFDRSILKTEGALDGTWKFADSVGGYLFNDDHTLSDTFPVGVRLLRPNGIVEHEIALVGEDLWKGSYSPSNIVTYLNGLTKPGTFFWPGNDDNYGNHSVGVVNGQGEKGDLNTDCWNNTMIRTPGLINEGQQINPEVPVPYGEMVYVYSELDQSGGNIWQSSDGGLTFTNATLRFFIKRDSVTGTNVVFQTEPWYEVESCRQTCDGKVTYFDVTNGFDRARRQVSVTVGKGCGTTVNVVTKACVDRRLRDYDVDEHNVYTPAIIKWLQDGETLKWGAFLNDDGIIRLGEYWTLKYGYVRDLTLTEMYWLDIDPTAGEMVLVGGWYKPPQPVEYPETPDHDALTNNTMSVFMMITNKTVDVACELYGQAWSPYVLRSVEPTKTSWDYAPGTTSDWSSVTFKIKGIVLNGHNTMTNADNWADLRWFVFHEDSFHQPGNALGAEPFTADIEILDPVHRSDSPGNDAGWVDWVNDPEHPERAGVRPYYRWDINTQLKPNGVEVLHTNNVTCVTQP